MFIKWLFLNILIFGFQKQDIAADVMVIPRSLSCSIQSVTVVPLWTSPILCTTPL
jgi:hypothetical protein